jgi:hypothetical protein
MMGRVQELGNPKYNNLENTVITIQSLRPELFIRKP